MQNQFITTQQGLRRDSPSMRLFEKAKRLGIWNPSDIDFRQDAQDWQRLSEDEQDVILRLTGMFQAGEEAVTRDLLPLIRVVSREGRIEEEMFLTTFLFEEAKHVDFFNRFMLEVTGGERDLTKYHTSNYEVIFHHALPTALSALETDSSLQAQARASATYNMVVEGMLAETGYHAYLKALERNNLLPGTRQGIALLKQDESRHIAYGVFLLSRLMSADPSLWDVIEETMNTLVLPALGIIQEAFASYKVVPFGLVESDFTDYAMSQYAKRLDRINRSRGASLDTVYEMSRQSIDRDDA
jgi:ribonucleoside-diphosphate reductase beta chain